jgi:predicted permease
MLDAIRQDVRHAARSMTRRPLVSAVAVLSLGLGIGVNSAIFSLFESILLRRLAVPDPAALVIVTSPGPRPGSNSISSAGGREALFSYPLFRDLERVQTAFSGIAAHREATLNLTYGDETARGVGELVSRGYFSTLALRPALGRLLTADDDQPGRETAVVLSHGYWSRRFAADPGVVGTRLGLNDNPSVIVGVAPERFTGTTALGQADVFVPLAAAERLRGPALFENRRDHWLYVIGRLEPGLTAAQAEVRLAPPFAAVIREIEYPVHRLGLSERERAAFLGRSIRLQDGSRGERARREEVQVGFVLLFLVTGFVLLIACANVANLLLARAVDRAAEVALRRSLGASTGRMLQWLLTEACLLGVAGAAVALVVARMTIDGALSLLPIEGSVALETAINVPLLLFTGALGLGTGVLFGLFPAVQAIRSTPASQLGAAARQATASRSASRARSSLAVAQMALATALLAQTGLFITSLANVTRVDLGIRPEGLLTFAVAPQLNGYSAERAHTFFTQLEDRLTALPGVVSVSSSTIPLLGNDFARNTVSVHGFAADPDADVTARYARIGAGYFSTVGVPLLAGREFTRADDGPVATVAIVNEAFARKFRLGRDAVGKRMALGRNRPLDLAIVGLVADSAYSTATDTQVPQFFLPYRQADTGMLTFYVRSTTSGAPLIPAINDTVKALDAALPVERLRTMDDQVDASNAPYRVVTALSAALAGLATVLAGVGLYGMLAYSVARRAREFGIRMALGARAADVGRLVLGHVARVTAVGGVVGLVLAIGLSRLGQGLLFGVAGLDTVVAGGAALVIVCVALIAAAVPIRRAAGVEPAAALRAD